MNGSIEFIWNGNKGIRYSKLVQFIGKYQNQQEMNGQTNGLKKAQKTQKTNKLHVKQIIQKLRDYGWEKTGKTGEFPLCKENPIWPFRLLCLFLDANLDKLDDNHCAETVFFSMYIEDKWSLHQHVKTDQIPIEIIAKCASHKHSNSVATSVLQIDNSIATSCQNLSSISM